MYYIYDLDSKIIESKKADIHKPDNITKFNKWYFWSEEDFDFHNKKYINGEVVDLSVKDLQPVLNLFTDAKDSYYPYSGVPDIPADGESSCNIYILCVYKDSDIVEEDRNIILKTTNGKLDKLLVTLKNGFGVVKLTSSTDTCITKITAYPEEDNGEVEDGIIRIQFSPINEAKEQ